jgi:neutral ceramidase
LPTISTTDPRLWRPDTAVEAELQAAGGLIEGIAASRVPGGATLPPTGSLVLARSTSGELLGAIVGYAAHPTVLGEDNLYYSPDYVGPFRTALRRQLQEVPIVFLNGASGDLSTRSTRRARTLEENDRLGTALAAQFSALVNGARPIESTPLVTGAVSFEVRARSFPPAAEIDTVLGVARDRYRKAVDADESTGETRTAENDLIGAEALASLAASARDRRETATLRAVRIGDVAVIGVPAELFSELGNAIAKPRHVTILIIATCADGYLSYILPSQMAREAHYEALVSWVTPETGEQLVTAANQLVSKVVAEN